MSIRIEIICDTYEELASTIHRMAKNFGALSAEALDSARQNGQIANASSVEDAVSDSENAQPPLKRGRGRPAKAKSTDNSPPGLVPQPSIADEAPTPAEPEAPQDTAPEFTEKDVEDVIAKLTEHFRNGDTAKRGVIREWRDGLGLSKMGDLKAEHVEAARAFIKTLEA